VPLSSLNSIEIQAGAAAEADEVADWYEGQRPGLAVESILELDAAIERADESPEVYSVLYQEARRVLLRVRRQNYR
jgi:hypothetical protein